jgi:hypothetical protein
MYAKIETERLQCLRANQTRLRTEIYIDLQDAMQSDGNPDQIGQIVILPYQIFILKFHLTILLLIIVSIEENKESQLYNT